VAKAIEEQNRRADEQAEQAEGVPWRITHHDGDLYDLWNDTNTAKFGVQVSGPGVAGVSGPFDRIDGRSSEQFLIAPFGAGYTQVVVTWHLREDLSDEPRGPPDPDDGGCSLVASADKCVFRSYSLAGGFFAFYDFSRSPCPVGSEQIVTPSSAASSSIAACCSSKPAYA
jgi:hypothetical protein